MAENAKVKAAREFAREAVNSYNSGAISKTTLDAFLRAVIAYEIQVSLEEKLGGDKNFHRPHVGSKKRRLLGDLLLQ